MEKFSEEIVKEEPKPKKCFDNAAGLLLEKFEKEKVKMRMIHAICVANAPGQEGTIVGHAWIEHDGLAYDPTVGVMGPAREYRKILKVSYCKEYPFDKFVMRWARTNFPGPWDKQVKEHCAP